MFFTSSAWFLLLLLILPLVAYQLFRRKPSLAIPFSSIQTARGVPPSWRQRVRWLPPALGLAAIALMIVALARPQEGRKQTVIDSEGIAIEMVVDLSGSMRAMDFTVDDEAVDRLTAIKDVAHRFVRGGSDLDGRMSDLIGLVTFAGHADGLVTPTLDHGYLTAQLDQAKIVTDRNEDGTAIGDAIGLAVKVLADLRTNDDANPESKTIKSKVIILLTDGENNAGEIDPVPAAELAKSLEIKIYTIGVGSHGRAPVPVADPFTGRTVLRMMDVNIDETTLEQVAVATGGKYFRATDTESLAQIYAEIDRLEKSHVESRELVDYRELAIEPLHAGAITLPPLLLLALLCLAAKIFLSSTVLNFR